MSDISLMPSLFPSVHMIEEHYGHVNTTKHADRVLQGNDGKGAVATGRS